MPKSTKFRRLEQSIAAGQLIIPTIEKALLNQGTAWPEEYAIRVYNKERVSDGYFHPSSHCLAPELQLYYMFHPELCVPQTITSSQALTFQIGSAYHAVVQSMLIHLGLISESQVEVHYTDEVHHSSGTLDIIDMQMPNGEVMPVDIKSAGYAASIPKTFMDKYEAQMQVYMDVGSSEPRDKGLLLVIEKQSPHRMKEYVVKRDPALLDYIYRRWARVLEAVDFSDPSMLEFPCHERDSKEHQECPARFSCPLGPPTGQRKPLRMGNG